MADIPGVSLNLTGASGTQGNLSPLLSWRLYVLPRGGYASQISAGTTITFDSAAVASRFASGQWIQAGLGTANIRQVSGVGGNSITVSGAALTVAVNDRIFCIGSTQPTVTGGSATYTVPNTLIYQRDDDTSTLYTNSMITSNSDGLVQFFAQPNTYDALIQDSNQGNQGFIADLTVGAAGVSTSSVTTYGATVTINAALGVTGTLVVGATATFGANIGTTGYVLVGTTLTVNGNMGVTGTALFGKTTTVNGAFGVTGTAVFGATVTVNANFGITGYANIPEIRGGLSVTTGIFGVSVQPRCILYNGTTVSIVGGLGATTTVTWDTALVNVGPLYASGSTSSRISIPAGLDGFYMLNARCPVGGITNTPSSITVSIRKNGATIIAKNLGVAGEDAGLTTLIPSVANDYYEVLIQNVGGATASLFGNSSLGNFSAVKLF